MPFALACIAVAAALVGQTVGIRAFTNAVVWADLDIDVLKGRPAQLSWSDDDSSLYLQVVDGNTVESLKYRHYLIKKGETPVALDAEPTWAKAYWKWKSAKIGFGDPLMTIEVDSQQQVLDDPRDRNTPYLESGRSAPQILQSKSASGKRITNRLILKGHIIGEFVDEQIYPGYTFSWSPDALQLIAFRGSTGRLTLMNLEAQTETVGDSKDVWLPAWSEGGESIAFLERVSRKKFALKVVTTP